MTFSVKTSFHRCRLTGVWHFLEMNIDALWSELSPSHLYKLLLRPSVLKSVTIKSLLGVSVFGILLSSLAKHWLFVKGRHLVPDLPNRVTPKSLLWRYVDAVFHSQVWPSINFWFWVYETRIELPPSIYCRQYGTRNLSRKSDHIIIFDFSFQLTPSRRPE